MAKSFPFATMVEMLEYWNEHDASKPAFVFVDKHNSRYQLTRSQVYHLGGSWAAILEARGVGRGHRVVSTLVNCPERVLCDVGIIMAGAIAVNAQCMLADGADLLLILRESEANAVCVNPDLDWGPWTVLQQHVQLDPLTHAVTSSSLPHLRHVFFIRRTTPLSPHDEASNQLQDGNGDRDERTNTSEKLEKEGGFTSPQAEDFISSLRVCDKFYKAEVKPDDVVSVFTTSGTTGFSKLAPNTHKGLLECFQFLIQSSLDQFSMVFSSSPLGWVGGYLFVYPALGKGRALLDMWYGPPDDLARLVWDIIVQEKCLSGTLMPFILSKILALEDRNPWKMKSMLVAGQPIKTDVVEKALRLADMVLVSYSSSELLMVSALAVTDVSKFQDFLVGKPLPCNVVEIRDGEGKEVPCGTKGQIYVKTAFMSGRYLSNGEDTTSGFTADGFLMTGDIGVMLEDGALLVEGRHPDVIHRGNYIFYPSWLETRIMRCCPVLQEVFVIAVPDPEMGHEICACFVSSDPTVDADYVREKVESDILTKAEDPMSARPRYYLRFEEVSRTYTDKPARGELRRLAAERLGLV